MVSLHGRPAINTVLGMHHSRRRVRVLTELLIVSIAVVTIAHSWIGAASAGNTERAAPAYDPPVLAGQMVVPIWCAGGVYARLGDEIVVTSSGHCLNDGGNLYDPDGVGIAGKWGPNSYAATCAHPGYRCTASDMNYLIVAPDRIPWGHLNEIDMGAGGYRVISPGLKPLECDQVADNDPVEFDGRGIYRTGHVLGQREYLPPVSEDPIYFPCIVIADIPAATGDSGGVVLVRGVPAGIASRRFGDLLGFTPLGSGLAELGLSLCDTPNCGLTPP
jgi:hypothetical protein